MLSKAASNTIFWVFGMTRPGIEPRSPGSLVNTLPIRPMARYLNKILMETKKIKFTLRNHFSQHFITTIFQDLVLCIYPNPPPRTGSDTKSILKQGIAVLKSEFSFSCTGYLNNARVHCLINYLSIDGGRIYGFMHFPRALARSDVQTPSFWIWTLIANSI